MSPAIPSPPGTGDVWGNALNNFLEVSLVGADGTLSAAAIAQVEAAAGATAAIDVTRFGVPTDGVTDCTSSLKTVITNAVANAISAGTNYAEIFIPAGKYVLSGATTKGGTTKGNAQIPLPVISPTAEKFTLIIRSGYGGGDSLPLWSQTVGQTKSGACLYTTLTGQSYDATYGAPSVLGGPTSEQGYGNSSDSTFLYSNMHVILDGVSVCCSTVNPTIAAFDFQGIAQLTVGTAGAFCDAATTSGGGSVSNTFPTHSSGFGLRPPSQGNNDLCNIYSWSVEGYYTGLYITEHCVVTRVCAVYCNRGIAINSGPSSGYAHGNIITYASVESCGTFLIWDTNTHCIVETLDIEHNHGTFWDGGNDIDDGSNNGRGYVGFQVSGGGEGEGTEPVVNGALNIKIVNVGRKSATANTSDGFPAVPATGVALKNPLWRDAIISISGGTITAIAINHGGVGSRTLFSGTSLGVPGISFPLPSGASVTLTYTGSPTWVWTLL